MMDVTNEGQINKQSKKTDGNFQLDQILSNEKRKSSLHYYVNKHSSCALSILQKQSAADEEGDTHISIMSNNDELRVYSKCIEDLPEEILLRIFRYILPYK